MVKNLPSKKKKKEKKNLPSKTRDMGSIPGWGTMIAHAKGQLSPRASTEEGPMLQ